MSGDMDRPQVTDIESIVRARTARLLRSQDGLREEMSRLLRTSAELASQLKTVADDNLAVQDSRRAALNLMEDAVLARSEALTINAELQRRIEEHRLSEFALREAESRLQTAHDEFRRLNIAFDQRVLDRTREMQDREQRLRDLAAQLKRTEGKERQRLGRLLHDHVQQLLVAARMRLEYVASDLNEPQQAELQKAGAVLNDAIQATRDLSVQLTPPLLYDQGLPAALEWLTARTGREHGLEIHRSFAAEANPVDEEDRDILFSAAQEFLLNVVKHAQTSAVEIRLDRTEHWIRLEVRDRGAGFDAEQQDGRGSYGLFQLRQRLEAVGGLIDIESSPGQGTRAVAAVPCAAPSSNSPAGPAHVVSECDSAKAERGAVTVVVVDDHSLVREGLVHTLERHSDIAIVGEAADGSQGVEVVLATRPQVVLMDVNMPYMNGIEATRRILAQLPQTKVIGLSLEERDETERSMKDAGAVKCMTKSSATNELVRAILSVADAVAADEMAENLKPT